MSKNHKCQRCSAEIYGNRHLCDSCRPIAIEARKQKEKYYARRWRLLNPEKAKAAKQRYAAKQKCPHWVTAWQYCAKEGSP